MSKPTGLTTASILSISLVGGVSTLITGILPQLEREFATVSTTMVEWLVTAANISALVTLLANPYLTRRWGIKKVVVTGLWLAALTGVIPLFTHVYWLVLLSRFALGLGIGLFSPHAIGLIAHTYHGELRARLLGYQTGLGALGNALFLALAGLVVAFSWRNVFLLYLLLGGVALLASAGLPASEAAVPADQLAVKKLPVSRWLLVALAFVTYLLIWGVQLKLPRLFLDRAFGSAELANWTLSAMNMGGLLAGLTFGRVHRYLHQYTLTLGYAGAALAVVLLLTTANTLVAVGSAVFFNFIYSYTGPYLVYRSQLDLPPVQIDAMSSWLTIATVISAFFAPPVWNLLGALGPGTVTTNVLLWAAGLLGLIAVAVTAFFRHQPQPILERGNSHDH
ncbi:MFS transporter [Schleiferilactobacillus harbinensis]|jgi:MFS family permease|uniref:MFS transporter n=1 Tax=Schleiferilactobacillus harbinensis TaxID=304207 RepID=UPI00242E4D52|nr:MFS transporter [Schleiferilactobacillus harbinensis]MCI1687843.1 MFS transporter [Schleiferilactobacillus harbinensis]MCI1784116.1 MFS transporter [Schleiferilactobacillus harbinensis]MCI1849230.1 MFS transporter [Schleiferilactobacillus harbinensis]